MGGISNNEVIKNMDEFYKKYLPEYDKKYPITMKVSEEEAEYLKWRRGIWREVKTNEH